MHLEVIVTAIPISSLAVLLYISSLEKWGRQEERREPGIEFFIRKYNIELENVNSGHFDQNKGSTSHYSSTVFSSNRWQAAGQGALRGNQIYF